MEHIYHQIVEEEGKKNFLILDNNTTNPVLRIRKNFLPFLSLPVETFKLIQSENKKL